MVRNLSLVAAVIVSVVLAPPVRCEKVDLPPEELLRTATHVITGRVTAIYERTEAAGNCQTTYYVAEIRVGECEKGEGIEKGSLLYARYWRRGWIGKEKAPPDTSGHRGLPNVGDSMRVFLARKAYDGFSFENKDGGFNVIGANGFEKLKPASKK
jgi:hypothetical protein